jgi:hypothetical protein
LLVWGKQDFALAAIWLLYRITATHFWCIRPSTRAPNSLI